jgi:Tol biopolymer transport system component
MTETAVAAVFLSYASQDFEAARTLCEGLRAAGIEVWLDQSELRGGDLWEHAIRSKIRECALFVPLISQHTQERPEGFFRLEWKLAVDRSHLMAAEKAFLLPVVTDAIPETQALVPERFREVQWTSLPHGVASAAFIERVKRLLAKPVAARAGSVSHELQASGERAARPPAVPQDTAARAAHRARPYLSYLLIGIAAAILMIAGATYWITRGNSSWRNPLANAQFARLTELSGKEQAAAISRDGVMAAFLSDHDGHTDAWLTRIGSGTYRNLTAGAALELVNTEIRTLGFSADGTLVTVWARSSAEPRLSEVSILAAPVAGGPLKPYLAEAAEISWSSDGRRLVYHTAAPGDPMFVRAASGTSALRIYTAPAGVHCHFQVWSPDDAYIYFARGVPPDAWDIWRIRPSGADLERITHHNSRVSHPVLLNPQTLLYLATDADGSGPWLYALDLRERIPHRLSLGLERYTSLAASADGQRLLATVAVAQSSLWSVSLTDQPAGTAEATRLLPESSGGVSPRLGPNYLLYVAHRGGSESIWKFSDGAARQLWSDAHVLVVGAPAIAPDGERIAFTVAEGPQIRLYVMSSDGSHLRVVTDSLSLRGNPVWGLDGQTIISAVMTEGEPRLSTIPLNGSPPVQLVAEYSIDPVWSRDGQFLLYSGADLGTTFPVRAVTRDGRPYGVQTLILPRGARRIVFWREGAAVVVLRGELDHKEFWLVDLRSGAERQLTKLAASFVIHDFDVSADGSRIVFDRSEDTSQIALIERGH